MTRTVKVFCFIIGMGACVLGGFSSAAAVDFTYQGGALWGSMEDAVIDGRHLFCAMDHGLIIMDIADPASPSVVSTYPLLHGFGTCLAVSGNYVYMGTGETMLILDVSDVTSPQPIGDFPVINWVISIGVSGSTAYVCDTYQGMRIVDVSDPANPVEVGFFSTQGSNGDEVCIARGNYVYLASWWNFWIVDVTDPANPQQAGYYHSPDRIQDIALSESTAYLASDDSGLVAVDISDPSAPAEASRYPIGAARAYTTDVRGNFAFLGIGSPADGYGVKLFDISDPSNPVLSGQISAPSYAMHVSAEQLFVTNQYSLYRLFDVSDPSNALMQSGNSIANYGFPGYGQEIATDGRYVYVAGGNMGLVIVDNSDPTRPTVVSQGINPNRCFDLDLQGRYVYLADDGDFYTEGLKVVDVSNPADPAIVGSLGFMSCNKVTVDGNHAFLGGSSPTNYIVDISDPTNPVELGTVYVLGVTGGFAVKNNYLYISYGFGIVIADISDPADPMIIDTLTTDAPYGEILMYKGYLIAAVTNGFQVLDVTTNPLSPTPVAFCASRARDIKPYGDYLFVGNYQGVTIIDMSNPTSPEVLGAQPLYHGADAVAPYYNGVAAYDPDGLTVFQVSMPACCTHPGDADYNLTTNLADVVYLINLIFKDGPPLPCPAAGDANGDCSLNIGDAVYLVDYIFRGGDAPVCGDCP